MYAVYKQIQRSLLVHFETVQFCRNTSAILQSQNEEMTGLLRESTLMKTTKKQMESAAERLKWQASQVRTILDRAEVLEKSNADMIVLAQEVLTESRIKSAALSTLLNGFSDLSQLVDSVNHKFGLKIDISNLQRLSKEEDSLLTILKNRELSMQISWHLLRSADQKKTAFPIQKIQKIHENCFPADWLTVYSSLEADLQAEYHQEQMMKVMLHDLVEQINKLKESKNNLEECRESIVLFEMGHRHDFEHYLDALELCEGVQARYLERLKKQQEEGKTVNGKVAAIAGQLRTYVQNQQQNLTEARQYLNSFYKQKSR